MEVTVPEHGVKLPILKEDLPALLKAGDQLAPARLLPCFDALIMGHKDKTRFIEPSVMNRVFLPLADVASTIFVDGRVQGVWTMRKMKKAWRLELSPFNRLSENQVEAVEAEIERLQSFTGFDVELTWKTD